MRRIKELWSLWASIMEFMGGAVTVSQDLEQRQVRAQAQVLEAEKQIAGQKYLLFMARRELDAITEWKEENDIQ